MIDYKAVAEIMLANKVDNTSISSEEFNEYVKKRNLKFEQTIDEIEVWGNKSFQILVIHKNNNYQIL